MTLPYLQLGHFALFCATSSGFFLVPYPLTSTHTPPPLLTSCSLTPFHIFSFILVTIISAFITIHPSHHHHLHLFITHTPLSPFTQSPSSLYIHGTAAASHGNTAVQYFSSTPSAVIKQIPRVAVVKINSMLHFITCHTHRKRLFRQNFSL